MRDLRDPQALGELLLHYAGRYRALGTDLYGDPRRLSVVADYARGTLECHVPDYDGGGLMSNDPAKHHSKVRQDAYIESDGGE